jgi:hypothetical protein
MHVISWWSILIPALTYVFGLPATGFLFAKLIVKTLQGLSLLIGLPTLVVTYCVGQEVRKTKALVSFFSIILFVLYHNFSISSIYSLLWTVPILLSIIPLDHLFLRALSAVFLGHACGTFLFIATHTVPDMYWVSLLPIAFVERIIMAILLYLSILCMEYGKRWVSVSFVKRSQSHMVTRHLWSSI